MEQKYKNCFDLVKEKEQYSLPQFKEDRYFKNRRCELESTITEYCRLIHDSKIDAKEYTTTETKNKMYFDARKTDEYIKIDNLFSTFTTYQPYYYAENAKIYSLSTSGDPDFPYKLNILSPEALFCQNYIPYIDCDESNTIYISICTLIKHCRTKAIKYYKDETKQLKELINDSQFKSLVYINLYFHYLFKYLLSCNLPAFPYRVPLPLTVAYYYVVQNDNLCFAEFLGANPLILTKKNITYIFRTFEETKTYQFSITNSTRTSKVQEFFKVPKPSETDNIRNLFESIKKLCNPSALEKPVITKDKNIIFTNANVEQYCFHYVQDDSSMLFDHMNNMQKNVITVPINTTIKPTLTDTLANYLCQLAENDLDSLRTLAKLTAATFSYQQPLQYLVLTEGNILGQRNLLLFLNFVAPVMPQVGVLNTILKSQNTLDYLIESNNNPTLPFIILLDGTNTSKNSKQERSQLTRLISGSSMTFKDAYVTNVRLNNNAPIVFSAESMSDYQFLSSYSHMSMKLYCDDELTYIPSTKEREWLTQIFIPWGKEILCNANLDITKKRKNNNPNSSKNSIEEFLNLFVRKKEKAHIYPEDLYASYLRYSNSKGTNPQLIKKAPFIKLIKGLKRYEYCKYHIRDTSSHKGSNRWAFKNMELDEVALNNYIEKKESPTQDTYNLKEDLEVITEHYRNLFDPVISPDTKEKIKLQSKPSARIVRTSNNEQPNHFETFQKVTKTINK